MNPRLVLAVLMSLFVAAAAAQPARPGSGVVDTREDCMALQGTWAPERNGWQSACEVPWSREDCLQLGGAWTQVAKAASGGRCIARSSEFGVASQCLDRGGRWGPANSRSPSCTFEPGKTRVLAGSRAPDAGKLCESQKDCTHSCVYQGPPVGPEASVVGRCRASTAATGCYSMVESGRLAGSVCVKP